MTRRHRKTWFALGSSLWLCCTIEACSSLQVGSDFDRAAHFSSDATFAWMPRESSDVSGGTFLEVAHETIRAELTRKGLTYVAESAAPDIVVDVTLGTRERTDVRSYPPPYTGPWLGPEALGYYLWWGYPYWGETIERGRYPEGTLAIDVFDAHSHKPVWHGWAEKELTRADTKSAATAIRKAVKAILRNFPPT